ncbi:hypothetical protein ACROYT_G028914 [Oculina patagonica]
MLKGAMDHIMKYQVFNMCMSDQNGNHKRALEQARVNENATSGQSQYHNLLEWETESESLQNCLGKRAKLLSMHMATVHDLPPLKGESSSHFSEAIGNDSCPTEGETEYSWNEVDESEMCAGTLDTMLTSLDFVEDCKREKVLKIAPGESNHPISVFKDQYCEELAYPAIFCDQARADNKDRNVPVYYSDILQIRVKAF